MNKNEVMSMLDYSMDSNLNIATDNGVVGCDTKSQEHKSQEQWSGWNWWANCYYPYVIKESYPVYYQERTADSGKKAFEIIKILNDKKLVKLDKVKDFINLMDEIIKII